MAFNIIYFFIILTFGIWIVSLYLKNEILAILSALLMYPLSIYIFTNGMDIFGNNNILSIMFAAVIFCIATMTWFDAAQSLWNQS